MNAPQNATGNAVKTSVASTDDHSDDVTDRGSRGRTIVADAVVATVVGIAAREVPGLHALEPAGSRALGAVRSAVGVDGARHAQGVTVEVNDRSAAVSLDLVADYGISIADVAADVRRNVSSAVRALTGLTCSRVDVVVHDVQVDGHRTAA
ncbi:MULTISPECIES: Asp23/Gls24 family envelope stress response protein [unclassified Rhodococcus (in: high G+C Gram-positive bacteria)]|uniref:Asp23/Gls24 family envelope stress response protein n=1 Tax=unclassified Rhodococcus (in: high G+C Gram-positive bacteria) TaxID=192944 RepID=UPI001C9AD82A|nr:MULTISPECIES: Asp23/Gls24 family envelope stress response protein [unclassified Rhodococcus (in: high G+C Gram-positive bacteria)]